MTRRSGLVAASALAASLACAGEERHAPLRVLARSGAGVDLSHTAWETSREDLESLRTFGRVWKRSAESFGRTGEPSVVDGRSERFRELSGLPPGPARDALARAEVGRQLRRAWSEGHVAPARRAPRRPARVGRARGAVDRRRARSRGAGGVPAALAKVPVAPEVLAGRDRLATVWELEIEVSISPPVPLVAVEFDEALGRLGLRVPRDRRIWAGPARRTRVRCRQTPSPVRAPASSRPRHRRLPHAR